MAHPSPSFIDGFPADPSSPDYAVQCAIDGEIRNCYALRGESANNGLLYPAYFASSMEERASWLIPAVRRLHWNLGREPWRASLTGLLNLLLPIRGERRPTVPDDVLVLMAEMGPWVQVNGGNDCHRLNGFLADTLHHRHQPMPQPLMDALQGFVRHLIHVHCHDPGTFDIAWNLWMAPENTNDGDPCFSAIIRRSLRSMDSREREKWKRLLNLRGKNVDAHGFLSEKYRQQLRKAVLALGGELFVVRFREWMDATANAQPATMSAAGREVLLLLLLACRCNPELVIDGALYTLCGVRWTGEGNDRLAKEWLGPLLMVIGTRPCSSAFACAERLRSNDDFRPFSEVAAIYDQLLDESLEGAVSEDGGPRLGVDGYDLNSDPELYRAQVNLDRVMRTEQSIRNVASAWGVVELRSVLAARRGSADPVLTLRAIAKRLPWVSPKQKQSDECKVWFWRLSDLADQLLQGKPALGEQDLIALMNCDREASCYSNALFARVSEPIQAQGYSLPIVESMKRWHASMYGGRPAMDLRHRIGWLLWFEDVSELDAKVCWSNRIRKDLRNSTPTCRAAWKQLIENVTFGTGEKPPKKWMKPAAAALAAVGAAEFRDKMQTWFAPFRSGEPLRLTVTGRDILRNLIFYALLAKDQKVDEAVSWFASARWKTKKDQACVASVLPAFVSVMIERSHELAYAALETYNRNPQVCLAGRSYRMYEELCVRLGRSTTVQPPAPAPAPDPKKIMEKLWGRYLTSPQTSLEGDNLFVTGVRDTYVINITDSSISRVSDGKPIRIEIDYSDPVFGAFRSMLDAVDINDPFQPNYFRIKVCASILEADDQNASLIVTDEAY